MMSILNPFQLQALGVSLILSSQVGSMTSFPRLSILRYAGALMGEDGTPLWRGRLIEAERGNTLLSLGLDDRVLHERVFFL